MKFDTLDTSNLLAMLRAIAGQIAAEVKHSPPHSLVELAFATSEETRGLSDEQAAIVMRDRIAARFDQSAFFAPLMDILAPTFPMLNQPEVRERLFHWHDGIVVLAVLCAAAPEEIAEHVSRYRGHLYREIAYSMSRDSDYSDHVAVGRYADSDGTPREALAFYVLSRKLYTEQNGRYDFYLPTTEAEMDVLCAELDTDIEHDLDELDVNDQASHAISVELALQVVRDYMRCYTY